MEKGGNKGGRSGKGERVGRGKRGIDRNEKFLFQALLCTARRLTLHKNRFPLDDLESCSCSVVFLLIFSQYSSLNNSLNMPLCHHTCPIHFRFPDLLNISLIISFNEL